MKRMQPATGATTRRCTKCGETKPLGEFYRRDNGYYRGECKACIRAKTARHKAENPEMYSRNAFKKHLRSYGLTLDEYERILLEQDNRCAICRRENPHPHIRLATDHDHETGVVRGILCTRCNTGLGWIESVGVDAVADYLTSLPRLILEGTSSH